MYVLTTGCLPRDFRFYFFVVGQATMAASPSDDDDVFTIHLDDDKDVQMHFEVERYRSLRGVFDQYSIIEGVPREFFVLSVEEWPLWMCIKDAHTLHHTSHAPTMARWAPGGGLPGNFFAHSTRSFVMCCASSFPSISTSRPNRRIPSPPPPPPPPSRPPKMKKKIRTMRVERTTQNKWTTWYLRSGT